MDCDFVCSFSIISLFFKIVFEFEIKYNFYWEKVRTTNFTTSKTKKNIKKFGDNHNIEKLYKRDQNVKKGKDQNVKKS